MHVDHPSISRCVVSFSLMVCDGHHISLRLLSLLRVMNISPSQKKRQKKKKGMNGYYAQIYCALNATACCSGQKAAFTSF